MTPCSCGHTDPAPPIIGIQLDYYYAPALILWNCRACGSTRGIPWAECTEEQRREAYLADLSRQSGNEMTAWGG